MKVGDVVRLKSGGPKMTVSDVDDDEITCKWFPEGDQSKVREGEFYVVMLVAAEG
jgi:uncharacterized protein YodC (DUF2158 family)